MSRKQKRPNVGPLVKFTADDPGGLWRKGDAAVDLGWEALNDNGDPVTPVRVLRVIVSGETLSLSDPYGRGLITRR